ncbi:MAG TPA: excisionase family DNA-binding protein [Burkholderiaceae bacterium]|nr:excisionase family DNA-binding protein [Burkholderiaceae bacterium]
MSVNPHIDELDVLTTVEAAQRLGLAVRSVQSMVDRGELQAWRTPGGHRRISRASVERWLSGMHETAPNRPDGAGKRAAVGPRVLLIEDSAHFQNLIQLVVRQALPQAELAVAGDGVTGLVMYGRLDPDVLIVDILLPGIDGAALIASLRANPALARARLVVVTSLSDAEIERYAFALKDVPIVRKDRLVTELPQRLAEALAAAR